MDILWCVPDKSVQTCVTSPPYFGLRDYGVEGQHGAEGTPEAFVANLVEVFREVRRVLKDDGTLWLNLGDSYCSTDKWGGRAKRPHMEGLKPKDLIGIPWMVAFALRADGWYLRQDIVWAKPNPMPESVTDRCTKAHEYIFLLSKSPRYYFDAAAIKEPVTEDMARRAAAGHTRGQGKIDRSRNDAATIRPKLVQGVTRNKRDVWTVTTQPFKGAHFATFPPALVEPCILAGSRAGDTVLDPYMGAGTTGLVARKNNRQWIGCELNPEYAAMATNRIYAEPLVNDEDIWK